MRLAILGHRGIPNSYGGFETLAEELSGRLVKLGIPVTVYCRSQYFKERPSQYQGARLVYLPTLSFKALDTLAHTLLSAFHLVVKNTADTVLVVNVGNVLPALFLRLAGKKVVLCVDGLDWQRKKWGALGRLFLKACSYTAPYVAHELVTDAESVQEFYACFRGVKSAHIPYGTDLEGDVPNNETLKKFNLLPKRYFIYVARFEPENNPLFVVESFCRARIRYPLVMVGDNRYHKSYVARVKAAAKDAPVIFAGVLFGAAYKTLLKNSLACVRAAQVGGASPFVIEAMGKGVCVLANDKPENRERLNGTGLYYRLNTPELTQLFKDIAGNPQEALEYGMKARERAAVKYSWESIVHEYAKTLRRLNGSVMSKDALLINAADSRPRMLIAGAGGMLGKEVYEYFKEHYQVHATDIDLNASWLDFLDVRDKAAYERLVVKFRPRFILHLAALTDLEACEKERTNAFLTNSLSVKHASQIATRYRAKLVYISSSGVFDGAKDAYTQEDEPRSINSYGFTKYCGELFTEQYASEHLIVRSGWMMSGGPDKDKKFVAAVVRQVVSGQSEIHAVADKFGAPTYGYDLARNLHILLRLGAHGLYHMVCGGQASPHTNFFHQVGVGASRYDLAQEIVFALGYRGVIKVLPVSSAHFSHTYFAPRPRSENLINARLTKEGLNRMQPWKMCLRSYLARDFAYAKNPALAFPSYPPLTQLYRVEYNRLQ